MKQWELRGVTSDVRPEPIRLPEANAADSPIRTFVDQFPAIFWTTDRELRLTAMLGAGLSRVGVGPNQLVGTSLFEVLPALANDGRPIGAHVRALEGQSGWFRLTWNGASFDAGVAPLRDASNAIIGTICIAVEVPVPAAWAEARSA